MITPEQVIYLKQLDRFLLTIPPEKFNLGVWSSYEDPKAGFNCNTTACAVGWGSVLFHRQKFRVIDGMPEFGDQYGWTAVEAFFGLTEEEAEYLFNPRAYNDGDDTPAHKVAWRIRAFLRQVEARPEYRQLLKSAKIPKPKKKKVKKKKVQRRIKLRQPDPELVKLQRLQQERQLA